MVSTFHLCSQVLGDMRRKGTLQAPAVSLVVDFAAHASWVNPDVDLHLCLHPSQAARVTARGARRVEVCAPVVLSRFEQPRFTQDEARESLGLDSRDKVVLVVAGSWGAGDVVSPAKVLADEGRCVVLVAAGDNDRLLTKLRSLGGRVRAVGWVDDMDAASRIADLVLGPARPGPREAPAAGSRRIRYPGPAAS